MIRNEFASLIKIMPAGIKQNEPDRLNIDELKCAVCVTTHCLNSRTVHSYLLPRVVVIPFLVH